MENTSAYQIGQIAGAIMMLALMLAICVLFIISLIKAFSTRRKGWIIAASILSLPFLLLLVAFFIAFVVGFKRGLNHSADIVASSKGETSQLLTASMTPVSGNSIPYEISLPWLSDWKKTDTRLPYDYMFSYHDAYIGVIAEGIGLGTPQRVCDFTQKNLASKTSTFSATTPVPIEIDSRSWLTYDATATVNGINVKYRYFVYADTNYTFQIMTWTGPALFNHYAPVFDRVAKSFKMPK